MDAFTTIRFMLFLTIEMLSTICVPEAEYLLFPGFDLDDWTDLRNEKHTHAPHTIQPYFPSNLNTDDHDSTEHHKHHYLNDTTNSTASTPDPVTTKIYNTTKEKNWKANAATVLPLTTFECPENENPTNIGPYGVPTQRDLVFFSLKKLHEIYTSYHQKAMLLLDDMQKVVLATEHVAGNCSFNRLMYRKCVKHVKIRCELITKSLTFSLEQQRQDILQFDKNTACKLQDMKVDPLKLVKILASEEASLDFALPGFLRLLNICQAYCLSPFSENKFKAIKPTRHLTDTDLVIRHFLTKKNYKRLLKSEKNLEVPIKINATKSKKSHKKIRRHKKARVTNKTTL